MAEAATESSGSKWQLTARREAAITAAAVALNHDFWRVNNLLAASPWAGNLSPSPSPSRARFASYLNLVARAGALEACSKNKVISGATCRWHAMQLLMPHAAVALVALSRCRSILLAKLLQRLNSEYVTFFKCCCCSRTKAATSTKSAAAAVGVRVRVSVGDAARRVAFPRLGNVQTCPLPSCHTATELWLTHSKSVLATPHDGRRRCHNSC